MSGQAMIAAPSGTRLFEHTVLHQAEPQRCGGDTHHGGKTERGGIRRHIQFVFLTE